MSDARIRAFQPGEESLLANVFNRCFVEQPNFWSQTAQTMASRVTQRAFFEAAFDPTLLLLAEAQGNIIGMAHGCMAASGAASDSKPVGLVLLVGVDPRVRRQGVASALMAALASRMIKSGAAGLSLDPHGFLPFYSNVEGPQTSLFGMVEGIGIDMRNEAAKKFLQRFGFERKTDAANLRRIGAGRDTRKLRRETAKLAVDGYELHLAENLAPAVGGRVRDVSRFRAECRFVTAYCTHEDAVVGRCVGFRTPELGDDSGAIYDLLIHDEHRRKGIGRSLAVTVLEALTRQGARTVRVTVLPEGSPGAMELYRPLGFEVSESFVLYQ